MSRAIAAFALLLAVGCSADPTPPLSSATGEHEPTAGSAPTPPKPTATAAASASAPPNQLSHEAKDPASLLGGGAALEALPVRATETGGQIDPGLRQRLMAPSL